MRHRASVILSSITFWALVFVVSQGAAFAWLKSVSETSAQAKAKAAKIEAVREAEQRAAANARVQQCLASIKSLRRINAFVDAVREFHEAAAENSYANLAATPKGTREYRLRRRNYRRIKQTIPAVRAVTFPVPTRADCERRRRS